MQYFCNMRSIRIFALIFLGLAIGYVYRGSAYVTTLQSVFLKSCDKPVTYIIGDVFPEFGLSREEIKKTLTDAESLWEKSLGKELFVFSESEVDGVVINFIYDDRQAFTDNELILRATLKEKRTALSEVQETRQSLMEQYDVILSSYNELRVAYEKRLADYNKTVNNWNTKGGAHVDVYGNLAKEGEDLDAEMQEIVATGKRLKSLADELNEYGKTISEQVDSYNDLVSSYNTNFHDQGSFAQGTYNDRIINIYQYSTLNDLRIVLAHELGHALGFGHVGGDTSIMYAKTGRQSFYAGLSEQDITHAKEVCGITN